MPKTPCPRCGGRASDNTQGPDVVYCRRCGGLVPKRDDDTGDTYIHADPVANAIAKEAGHDQVGVIRQPRQLKGGL